MAEAEGCSASKVVRTVEETAKKLERKQGRTVTLQELIDKMEGEPNGRMTGKIRAGKSDTSSSSMQWIDNNVPQLPNEHAKWVLKNDQSVSLVYFRKSLMSEYCFDKSEEDIFDMDSKPKLSAIHEVMRSLHTPPIRTPTSPTMRSFSSEHADMKGSSVFFGDVQFNNNQTFYSLNPYFPSYQMPGILDQNCMYPQPHDPYSTAPETPRSEYPFTYIHPDSGARLTDPSAFLTSFIPSPITKLAPVSFAEDNYKPNHKSEVFWETIPEFNYRVQLSTSSSLDAEMKEDEDDRDEKVVVDNMLKFDPPMM